MGTVWHGGGWTGAGAAGPGGYCDTETIACSGWGSRILAAPTAATFSGGLVCVAAVLAIVALLPKLRRYHL